MFQIKSYTPRLKKKKKHPNWESKWAAGSALIQCVQHTVDTDKPLLTHDGKLEL